MIGTIIIATVGYGVSVTCAAAGVFGIFWSFIKYERGDKAESVAQAHTSIAYLVVAFVVAALTRWVAGI